MTKEVLHVGSKAEFVAWFDRSTDCLCVFDRKERERLKLKPGEPMPEEHVMRVPLKSSEVFIQAVMNSIQTGSTVAAVMRSAVMVADLEARAWLQLGEELRAEFLKRSAGIEKAKTTVEVPAVELARLRDIEAWAKMAVREGASQEDHEKLEGLVNGGADVGEA